MNRRIFQGDGVNRTPYSIIPSFSRWKRDEQSELSSLIGAGNLRPQDNTAPFRQQLKFSQPRAGVAKGSQNMYKACLMVYFPFPGVTAGSNGFILTMDRTKTQTESRFKNLNQAKEPCRRKLF